jgi:hypothetical protein
VVAWLGTKTALLFTDVAALTASTLAQIKNTVANSAYIVSLRAMIVAQLQAAGSTNLLTLALTNPIKALGLLANVFKFLVGGSFGLIGIAVTTAVVYFTYLADKIVKFGGKTVKVSEILSAAWEAFTDIFKPVFDLFSSPEPVNNIEALGKTTTETFSTVENVIIAVFDAFSRLFGFIKLGVQATVIAIANFANEIGIEMQFVEDLVSGKGIEKALDDRQRALDQANQDYINSLVEAKKEAENVDIYGAITGKLNKQQVTAKPQGRQTPSGESPAAILDPAEVKKQADLIAKIQKEQRDQALQNIKDTEAAKIQELQNSGKTQKQIDDAVFAEKVRTNQLIFNELKKQLAEEKTALQDHASGKKLLDSEALQAKKANLQEIQKAYKSNIDALNQLEQQHRDKVISLDKEIRDLKKQGQDGLREIARAGMTDTQVAEDKRLEIQQKTAQMRQLLNAKDYEQAAALGKELNALTLEQAKSAAEAQKTGGDFWAAVAGQDAYKASIALTTQALELQKAEEQAKAEATKAEAEKQRAAYENLGTQIEALNTTLTTGKKLDVVVDTTQVDVLKQKLDEIPPEKVIQIKWSGDKDWTKIPVQTSAPPLPAAITNAVQQLRAPNIPTVPQVQNSQNQAGNEQVKGVYKVQLASPAGEVSATVKESDIELYRAVMRGAKALGRTTRDF